jgi:hypothetical protein
MRAVAGRRCATSSRSNEGYKAIRVDFGGERFCIGARDSDISSAAGLVSKNLRAAPRVEIEPGVSFAAGAFQARSQSGLAIQIDAPPTAKEQWSATALFDPAVIARVFQLNPDRGDIVALMERGQKVVAQTGANPSETNWLPATEQPVGSDYRVAPAVSRTGATFNYATQPALGSDFYILSRFDNSARRDARQRSLILALAPLIMLATLYVAYSRAIQSELLRWIDGIKAAMVTRKSGKRARYAPEEDEMPTELRELAAAFNEMARESAVREPYAHVIARGKRIPAARAQSPGKDQPANHPELFVADATIGTRDRGSEPGRGDGGADSGSFHRVSQSVLGRGMRDVRIRQFAAEIVDNLSQTFSRPGLEVELKSDVHAALMIDRAIPLGLALVESVLAGLGAEGARLVSVRIGDLDDLRVELRVSTDGVLAADRPNAKLMAGLALQLDATCESPDVGTIIRRRFQAGPLPALSVSEETALYARV